MAHQKLVERYKAATSPPKYLPASSLVSLTIEVWSISDDDVSEYKEVNVGSKN